MQRGCQLLNVPLLIFLVLFVVFKLVHANVGCLYRVNWEQVQDIIIVLFYGHCETLFEHQIKAMWFLNKLNAALWAILLHPLDQHRSFLRLFFKLIFCLLLLNIVFQLLILTHSGVGPSSSCSFLGLLSCLASLNIGSRNRLKNGHVQWGLSLLVQHEKVVWQVR